MNGVFRKTVNKRTLFVAPMMTNPASLFFCADWRPSIPYDMFRQYCAVNAYMFTCLQKLIKLCRKDIRHSEWVYSPAAYSSPIPWFVVLSISRFKQRIYLIDKDDTGGKPISKTLAEVIEISTTRIRLPYKYSQKGLWSIFLFRQHNSHLCR